MKFPRKFPGKITPEQLESIRRSVQESDPYDPRLAVRGTLTQHAQPPPTVEIGAVGISAGMTHSIDLGPVSGASRSFVQALENFAQALAKVAGVPGTELTAQVERAGVTLQRSRYVKRDGRWVKVEEPRELPECVARYISCRTTSVSTIDQGTPFQVYTFAIEPPIVRSGPPDRVLRYLEIDVHLDVVEKGIVGRTVVWGQRERIDREPQLLIPKRGDPAAYLGSLENALERLGYRADWGPAEQELRDAGDRAADVFGDDDP